jgi:hypothetical protein
MLLASTYFGRERGGARSEGRYAQHSHLPLPKTRAHLPPQLDVHDSQTFLLAPTFDLPSNRSCFTLSSCAHAKCC